MWLKVEIKKTQKLIIKLLEMKKVNFWDYLTIKNILPVQTWYSKGLSLG